LALLTRVAQNQFDPGHFFAFPVLKYGQRRIELAKGKNAVGVGSKEELVATLKKLIPIIGSGALDT
jgi:hypothetical protein